MQQQTNTIEAIERIRINRLTPDREVPSLAEDVTAGLEKSPRSLSPKYFYDEQGSKLFEQICQTPEYYLTRTEAALLEENAEDIIRCCKPEAIVEFGSGTAEKTELLIKAANQHSNWLHYMPLDVCEEILTESAQRLTSRYPELAVEAWHGDFMHGMSMFENDHARSLYTFLGSSIGNFSRPDATRFLADIRSIANSDDWLLLGVDLVKDHNRLNAAYNDNDGYTAAFNLNVLNVLNKSLNADFDVSRFDHHAFYDASNARIEMRLVSACRQTVSLQDLGLTVTFEAGEHITTEYSRKYTPQSIKSLLREVGFEPQFTYTGSGNDFMLILSSCC